MRPVETLHSGKLHTNFHTIVYLDEDRLEVRHGHPDQHPDNLLFMSDGRRGNFFHLGGEDGVSMRRVAILPDQHHVSVDLNSPHITEFEVVGLCVDWLGKTGFLGLRYKTQFLAAEPDGRITLDRLHCGAWETFSVGQMSEKKHLIHIFGDSHSIQFSSVPVAAIHHLGPVTMYRVGRDGIQVFGFENKDITDGTAMGFVFGEIDVRVHVDIQRTRNGRDPSEVIFQLVGNYMTTLRSVQRRFPRSEIVVFSAVPPAGLSHPGFDQSLPRHGSDDDRVTWTLALNQELKDNAATYDFGFVDQYSGFHDENGLLDLGVSEDGVHLSVGLAYRIDMENIFHGRQIQKKLNTAEKLQSPTVEAAKGPWWKRIRRGKRE